MSHLAWAKDIVVVDSGSTDRTLAVLATFNRVRVFHRRFDTHANQWRYAIENTQIATDWILRLDADYQVSDALIAELALLDCECACECLSHLIRLCRSGSPAFIVALSSRTRFCCAGAVSQCQDKGHTEVWDVSGPIVTLSARIVHDDWKPTGQWLIGQARYMQRELDWIYKGKGGWVRWFRLRPPLMPIAVFLYCLFGRGLLLNGRSGIFYALQRMVAEAVLSLMVLEERLRHPRRSLPRPLVILSGSKWT